MEPLQKYQTMESLQKHEIHDTDQFIEWII